MSEYSSLSVRRSTIKKYNEAKIKYQSMTNTAIKGVDFVELVFDKFMEGLDDKKNV